MNIIQRTLLSGVMAITVCWALPASSEVTAGQNTTAYWQKQGKAALNAALSRTPNRNRAKNIILFVGDGNGIASVTAGRIFDGQSRGLNGEENTLSFEYFPYVALAKTYNTNQQTPDSAGTMTAMMTGVKTLAGVLSLGPEVTRADCAGTSMHVLQTLLEQAHQQGYGTGIVTTTRVTHATPAATYAHTPERDWEDDSEIPEQMKSCVWDIARQLVDNARIDVVMGGGRKNFIPDTLRDPEYPDIKGKRADGKNLLAVWQSVNPTGRFLWNRGLFDSLPDDFSGPVLALFEPSHMKYEADRTEDEAGEPSLSQMTAKALSLLKARNKGYFLMVESGRIDHAHHAGNAYRALVEVQELSKAVQVAVETTSPEDTLIIVTADHSHVFTIAGYPRRGNPILGVVVGNDEHGQPLEKPAMAGDGRPYTTLGYLNGPGYGYYRSEEDRYRGGISAGRKVSLRDETDIESFHQESLVPLGSETHGGEDVAIYARGPWAHLIHGVQEQSYIYYVMRRALGLDESLDQGTE